MPGVCLGLPLLPTFPIWCCISAPSSSRAWGADGPAPRAFSSGARRLADGARARGVPLAPLGRPQHGLHGLHGLRRGPPGRGPALGAPEGAALPTRAADVTRRIRRVVDDDAAAAHRISCAADGGGARHKKNILRPPLLTTRGRFDRGDIYLASRPALHDRRPDSMQHAVCTSLQRVCNEYPLAGAPERAVL